MPDHHHYHHDGPDPEDLFNFLGQAGIWFMIGLLVIFWVFGG